MSGNGNDDLSPIYLMQLIGAIENKLWDIFPTSKYRNVRFYIEKWHQSEDSSFDYWENFTVFEDARQNIDLTRTLHNIDGETLIKIAIDLGIETPDFIPCVPTFKNTLKEEYKSAIEAFNKAIRNIHENPDLAIGLANSTLESILKEIIKDGHIEVPYNDKATLYKLAETVLKGLSIYPDSAVPIEIKKIGSSLLNLCQNIESLRSGKTSMHGKSSTDYVIDDPLYAYFVVNSVTTIGLFIDSFYKRRFLSQFDGPEELTSEDDLPF